MNMTIELVGAGTRTITQVRSDIAIGDLLPSLVTRVGDAAPGTARWMAVTADGERIPPERTLDQAGVQPGDPVYVARMVPATDPDLAPMLTRDRATPSERTSKVVPPSMGTLRRARTSVGALLGVTAIRGTIDAAPVSRLVDTWKWTDQSRRLNWLVGRATISRTVTIGVVSEDGSGSDMAAELARALAKARGDRVALVDGDQETARLTRSMPGRHPTIGDVLAGSVVPDARFAGPVTFIGVDVASATPAGLDAYRALMEAVRPHAAMVVVDCGRLTDTRLIDQCEQLVLVAERPPSAETASALADRALVMATTSTLIPPLTQAFDRSMPHALGLVSVVDETAPLQIAALLAGNWR